MIDIHAHILPYVDDGSADMEESIEMLQMAADSGVSRIVATPHCNIPGSFENYWGSGIEERFRDLQREAQGRNIPVEILTGMEVFATPELPELLRQKKILTLNQTRYFLTEFAFDEEMWFCDNLLEACENEGYIPIIAHPERYFFVQEYPDLVYFWRERGYGIQVNKGSVLGRFGTAARRTANLLLEHNLVSCVASDAHSSGHRTPHMAELRWYLEKNFGVEYAEMLLVENPKRILAGEAFVEEELIPFFRY